MEIVKGRYKVKHTAIDTIRVIAKADGYLMLKFDRMYPFVKTEQEFISQYQPILIKTK